MHILSEMSVFSMSVIRGNGDLELGVFFRGYE